MTNIIIAKLIKDLPDIKAGAIFHSLVLDHWKTINGDQEYSNYELYYFHDDKYDNSVLSRIQENTISSYHTQDLVDWAVFLDYSDGTFKKFFEVKALTINDLRNGESNSI